ncbi:DUF222 domain-containing protein [Rhodococcus sp. Eu-32]|uniref:DUF222 domain-containing protein n=1 Tax=Rhodococcus sp. Eu-32 TaxID=1017319 RepID=UPI001402D322|nr:DUF222 domain-containing protein [Rhodococcus sp. Eu-32]
MDMPGGFEQIRRDADASASDMLTTLTDLRRQENIAAAATVHRVHDLLDLRISTKAAIYDYGLEHDTPTGPQQYGVAEPDIYKARLAAETEASVAFSLSRQITRDMITTGEELAQRLPAIDAAFTAGDLDYPRVRTIALTLSRAGDDTVAALEPDILAAAHRCTPRSLRDNIWRHWFDHNPHEATAARARADADERSVNIRRNTDGTASLFARITAVEASEIDAILDQFAATVCDRDPRTKRQLRADALVALMHQEDALACTCRTDECPAAATADRTPARPKPLIQVIVDLETLLRLTDTPATLSDGTVLDADTARLLATDAHWQAFLTEALELARAHHNSANDSDERPTAATQPEPTGQASEVHEPENEKPVDDDRTPDDDAAENRDTVENTTGDIDRPNDDDPNTDGPADTGHCDDSDGTGETPAADETTTTGGEFDIDSNTADSNEIDLNPDSPENHGGQCDSEEPSNPPPPAPRGTSSLVPRARRILTRGRTRPAPPLPPAHPTPGPGPGPRQGSGRPRTPILAGRDTALTATIDAYLAAAALDPALTRGPHPDGHGGHGGHTMNHPRFDAASF